MAQTHVAMDDANSKNDDDATDMEVVDVDQVYILLIST
jgi:hypothetical protein